MTALETLQALHQANPANADVNKAYLSMLTNPVMNGSLNNVLGGQSQSSGGSTQQPQAPMLPSDPNMMTAQEKAMAAQSQGGGQPLNQDGGYDSSFINNIPLLGGLLNAAGRVSAGGASGISSLLANGGALATGNTDKLSNPLTDALQGLEDPNKAKYLGTQLADKGLMDQNNGLKGALDFGSSLVLDPSLYLGGAGILGKLGKGANAAVKGVTGLDALGLAKGGASKVGDLLANAGKDAGTVASDIQQFSKGGQKLYDAGGSLGKHWDVPEAVKQYNQLADYGLNADKGGSILAQQADGLINGVSDYAASNLKDVNASIPKAGIMDDIKKQMSTSGYVNPDGSFSNKTVQKNYNEIENMLSNRQSNGIDSIHVSDAVQLGKDMGNKANTLLSGKSAEEQTMGRALLEAKSNINSAVHNATNGILQDGVMLKPDQVQELVTRLRLDPKKNANLINDISNARNMQDINNVLKTGYFAKDVAKNAFRAGIGENGVKIPLSKYDAVQMGADAVRNAAGGIGGALQSGAQALGKGITNAKAAMAQSASGKVAKSGIGRLVGKNKGFVGGALDRGLSGTDFTQQAIPTDSSSNQNDSLNQNITDLLNGNKANNSSIMNKLIMSGMAAPEATAIANNSAPLLTTDQNKGLLAIKNSLSTLDQLKSAYDGTKSMKGPGGGDISNLLGGLGVDQNAKVYNNIASGLLSTLKAAAGETGVLSDADTARIAGLVPNLNDTPENAQKKIDQIKQLLASKAQNTIQLIGR